MADVTQTQDPSVIDFSLDVNKTKSLKCRTTKNGNVQISIFKKFESQNTEEVKDGESADKTSSSFVRFKKIEDVIMDKAKTKQFVEFLNKFLA